MLAATLSPSYGIYSGYEHCENVPAAPGSEEYLGSEKYEVKARSLDGPLLPLVRRLNEIRRAEPALQRFENVRFLETHNEQLFGFVKGRDVAVVVNLDPFGRAGGARRHAAGPRRPAGVRRDRSPHGERYRWRVGRNYVGLAPGKSHVFKLTA